ncbi:MAG: 4-hydroxy-tetrahydrodipicolinate reductase [Leptospira sp.]|nr:4-hydroxy-tetrahydrodipicolinate reductase [Leptospira sp.]
MRKINIALIGATGRMGKAVTSVLSHSHTAQLKSTVDKEGSVYLGMDSGLHSGGESNKIIFSDDIDSAVSDSDVVIDFSSNQNLTNILTSALKHKKPLVIGTTGLNENQKLEINFASNSIPIVFSPNMAVGVNLLFKLVEIAANVLKDEFDIEIVDIHHRHKKDAPSGTAQKLKELLLTTLKRSESDVVYGREGIYEERDKKQIGIHTLRAGEVIGEHSVFFFSPNEVIEIKHRAEDRKTFAVGAVKAAEFISRKEKGLYDMYDVLGF